MGKKHNKKKKIKFQIINSPASHVELAKKETSVEQETTIGELRTDKTLETKYAYVTRDIKKILLLFAILLIVLIGSYYINEKTTFFYSIGNWFYKILNIYTA